MVAAALALLAAGCGGDDAADDATTTTGRPGSSEPQYGGHAHGSMGEVGTVADVEALGDGPSVGDRWEIPIGLSVCGRFVELPDGGPVDGVSAVDGGKAVVEPTDEASAGHAATLGSYAEAVGASLSTGELRLPDGIVPPEIEVGDDEVGLAGATFRTGDTCGTTRGEVQAWVYSADAVTSGEDILTVVTDPERVPFAEDGMALVIAFAPESSLPTLPPSAIVG